jgi:hypothetical protein
VAAAAPAAAADWLSWVVLGGIGIFVGGVVLRMILAARFPKGYRQWAKARRDDFAQRSEAWDKADDEFRR